MKFLKFLFLILSLAFLPMPAAANSDYLDLGKEKSQQEMLIKVDGAIQDYLALQSFRNEMRVSMDKIDLALIRMNNRIGLIKPGSQRGREEMRLNIKTCRANLEKCINNVTASCVYETSTEAIQVFGLYEKLIKTPRE